MFNVPGYNVVEKLFESHKTLVLRAIRESDQKHVILKILIAEFPTLRDIIKIRNEYAIIKDRNIDGIIKVYGLGKYKSTQMLILEDIGGVSLKSVLNNEKMEIIDFLKISIRLAKILGEIHSNNIIHKDIKSQNIVINTDTGEVKITDFSLSTLAPKESQNMVGVDKLQGTLAYMSPEQSGWMNRSIDYRSDFYSLGITFYEMLTGAVPFKDMDNIEIIHCHLAKEPEKLKAEIPLVLSKIVMKLLSKTPEDRYNSGYGLYLDLNNCLVQLQNNGGIKNFDIGQKDISGHFIISEKIYGRDKEVKTIADAFLMAQKGSGQMIVLHGPSGIGKSSLVNELQKFVTQEGGYFIKGRFDPHQQNVPYSAIIQSFEDIINRLLTENAEKLKRWKDELEKALSNNAQVIIDVIPRLELIIGEQSEVPKLPPAETLNRFNLTLKKFIKVFSKKEEGLFIFIDNIHLADSASIALLRQSLDNLENKNILLLCAYTDNAENESKYIKSLFNEIEKGELALTHIKLSPLLKKDVRQIIQDTLSCQDSDVSHLATLVMDKTLGNPFYVNQFLNALYQKGFISFHQEKGVWEWNLEAIKKREFTENAIDLMMSRFRTMKKEAQEILSKASCIGKSFDLNLLSKLCEKKQSQIQSAMFEAIRLELIIPTGSDFSQLNDSIDLEKDEWVDEEFDKGNIFYQFQHGQIMEALQSSIDRAKKKNIYFSIAQILLNKMKNKYDIALKFDADPLFMIEFYVDLEKEKQLFYIVNQLNLSKVIIKDTKVLNELSLLNYIVGIKAKKSTAYESARRYLILSKRILPRNIWSINYHFVFNLCLELAECEYLCGNYKKANRLFDLLEDKASSNQDKIKVAYIKMVQITNLNEWAAAVELGINALKLYDIHFPENQLEETIEKEMKELEPILIEGEIENLIHTPIMKDVEQKTILRLLLNMISPAYIVKPELLPLLAAKMLKISLEHGNSEYSSYSYLIYGTILGAGFGEYKKAYELGDLALKLSNKFNDLNMKGKVAATFCTTINHWRMPLENAFPIIEEGYLACLETGDILWAGYCAITHCLLAYSKGEELNALSDILDRYAIFLEKSKNPSKSIQETIRQCILNLKGLTKNKLSLEDKDFDEKSFIQTIEKKSFDQGFHLYYLFKMQLYFLYGETKEAEKLIKKSEKGLYSATGQFSFAEHEFYRFLILADLYPFAKEKVKESYDKDLIESLEKMKVWADNSPKNFEHKYLIMKAEMARITLKPMEKLLDLYDKSIFTAQENRYIQDEGIANELAAKYFLSSNKPLIAKIYLRAASQCYLEWGAVAKVDDLYNNYSDLLPSTQRSYSDNNETSTSTSSSSRETLDLTTVLKFSQNISTEIDLNRLIEKLMRVLVNSAGAEKGILILYKEGELFIEAETESKSDEVQIFTSSPIESSKSLALSVINYVKRTRESLVLGDALSDKRFQSDPYIERENVKSILCLPIIKQTKFIGLIYLENNLSLNTFTPERIDFINILSTQATISLENALYFDELNKLNIELQKEIIYKKQTEESLRQSEERYALAAKGANDGLWDWDLISDEIYYSPRWKFAIGYKENEIAGSFDEWINRVHPDDVAELKIKIENHIEGIVPYFESEYRLLHKDKNYRWMIARGLAVHNAQGKPYRLAGSQTDITKRKVAEEQLRHESLHDTLTDLPNWSLFNDRLFHVIKKLDRHKDYKYAVLFLDIDRFKLINDSLGHIEGNKLLIEFSRRILLSLRPEDTVARLGGDEFAILIDNIKDISDVLRVISRIQKALIEPFKLAGSKYFATVSIGIAMGSPDYKRAEDILRDADTAMYRAKSLGRNRYEIFDKEMHAQAMEFLSMENDLWHALERGELKMVYQPIISVKDNTLSGFEALIRWDHRTKGLISPQQFIPIAEETSLVITLGEWILQTVCAQNKLLQDNNIAHVPVAVNLSARQFQQDDLLETIVRILRQTKLEPRYLQLEITEGVLMKNINKAVLVLNELKSMGIKISLDDFGTGYSSLSYLKRFPIDKLKIDKSFIQNITTNSSDNAIGKAIIAMGHSLNLIIVAEGVENEDQVKFLRDQNCDEIQGFYFSTPLGAMELKKFITEQSEK